MQSRYNKICDFNELDNETQVFFLAKFYLFNQTIKYDLSKKVESYQNEINNLENKISEMKKEKFQIKDTEYNRILIENEAIKLKQQESLKLITHLKEEISLLQNKYEAIKQYKSQNKELNTQIQQLTKENAELLSKNNELESNLLINENELQNKTKQINTIEKCIKDLNEKIVLLEKENKQIKEEKNKFEHLYLRMCPNTNDLNTEYEPNLNDISIFNEFNTQDNKKEKSDENEIKINGHITIYNKSNDFTHKKNIIPNVKNKYVKMLEVNNATNRQNKFDSNFNSVLTVDDNNGIKEETISQKSEEEEYEENNYLIDNNKDFDYESYNSLIYDN